MNAKVTQVIILSCVLFFQIDVTAQNNEWKTAVSKDGKVTAKYDFTTRLNENGDKVPVVNSLTATTVNMDIGNCISLMKDVSRHKDFRGEKSSNLIRTISANEWVIYYYNDKTLITPAVDGSYSMIFKDDPQHKTAIFTITADPTLTEKTDASRMTYVKEICSFRELGQNQLEVTIKTTSSPGFKVPSMFMKKAFPKKLFDRMEKFIEMAHLKNNAK